MASRTSLSWAGRAASGARLHSSTPTRVATSSSPAATRPRAEACAAEIGGSTRGIGLDLAEPHAIAERLADVGDVEYLVLAAIERDTQLREGLRHRGGAAARHAQARRLHRGRPRAAAAGSRDDAAILIFGGLARDRPYPGSTTVTTVNGAVTSLVRTLVVELAPRRVNALHPAIVGDSPQWRDMPAERFEALVQRTPIGRLVTMAEVVDASRFLLENGAINGLNLAGRRRLALHVSRARRRAVQLQASCKSSSHS